MINTNEKVKYPNIKTAKQWVDAARQELENNKKAYLVDLQLASIEHIKSAPKEFQRQYFDYLTRFSYTLQEIAEDSGVSKEMVHRLTRNCGFSRKQALENILTVEPMLNFTSAERKSVRDWIRFSDRRRTINFNSVFKSLEDINYNCDITLINLVETLVLASDKGQQELILRYLLDSPESENEQSPCEETSHTPFVNQAGNINVFNGLLDSSLYRTEDVLDHQIGVKVPKISSSVKESDKMNDRPSYKTAQEAIGNKPLEEMDANDLEKVINGCPLPPIHDFNTALADDNYLRTVFDYFNYVPLTEMTRIMFGMGAKANNDYWMLQKKLNKLGVIRPRRNNNLLRMYSYAMGAFYGWFNDDVYRGLEYAEKHGSPSSLTTNKEVKSMAEEPKESKAVTVKEPERAASTQSQKSGQAILILDVTASGYSDCIATIYKEYPNLIVSFRQ